MVDGLKELLQPRDPNDARDVILEIRGAEGGQEANLWAADLMRMYMRYAEIKNWKVEVLNTSETDLGGIKEVTFEIHGGGAYSRLKFEGGTHRVQRVPQTEAQGRIHTSTATVSVLPKADEVDVEVRDEDLRVDVYRAAGHGGQGVNTTDSAVRLTHLPTGLVVTCQDERSQLKNKAKALEVLRSRLFEMELRKQQETVGALRRLQVGTGRAGGEDPHLQLPREPGDRPSHQSDAVQPGSGAGGPARSADRRAHARGEQGRLSGATAANNPRTDAGWVTTSGGQRAADEARRVGEALTLAAQRLGAVADGSERLECEVLLRHATGWERVRLLAHPERRLSDEQWARFEGLVARRMAAEPVAYLVGEREFYGRPFVVDRRVLIPRPETELLVELALASVERWRQRGLEPVVVDVGTGSGAIAVTLAAVAAVDVVGVDVSADALDVARLNADRLGQGARVRLLHGDLLAELAAPLHLVVANLPYLPEGRRLPREVSDIRAPPGARRRAARDGAQRALAAHGGVTPRARRRAVPRARRRRAGTLPLRACSCDLARCARRGAR